MNHVPKVKGWKIRRLYEWLALGIFDEELLLDIGWQLYARCEIVVAIWHAGHGAVPCPECQHPVPRKRPYRPGPPSGYTPRRGIACPSCRTPMSWADCRIALRGRPLCLDCGQVLLSDSRSGLRCTACRTQTSWKKYRNALRTRVRLPCPTCGHRLRMAKVKAGRLHFTPPGDPGIRAEVAKLLAVPDYGSQRERSARTCPECGKRGQKDGKRFTCNRCGYDVKWSSYKSRLRNTPELLLCEQCGFEFDWQSWARSNRVLEVYTGNPAPAAEFIIRWPRAQTPEAQMVAIDQLIHGVHVRGALAHHFVDGHEADVVGLLNQLALG